MALWLNHSLLPATARPTARQITAVLASLPLPPFNLLSGAVPRQAIRPPPHHTQSSAQSAAYTQICPSWPYIREARLPDGPIGKIDSMGETSSTTPKPDLCGFWNCEESDAHVRVPHHVYPRDWGFKVVLLGSGLQGLFEFSNFSTCVVCTISITELGTLGRHSIAGFAKR